MKIRVLWVPPHEKTVKCGEVYAVPCKEVGKKRGQLMLAAGEAELVVDEPAVGDTQPGAEG